MDNQVGWRHLPARALRECLKTGYGGRQLKNDLVAGLLVGVVAIPLAMALAIAIGAPPQMGLYTSIVAGFFCALLGGSRIQVVGPTAAFVVILVPVQQRFGLPGLLTAGLLAGLMMMALGAFRLGRMIEFIPFPVTTGFTSGVALVIAVLQLKDFFGITVQGVPEHIWTRVSLLWDARSTLSWADFTVGMVTLAILLLPRLPKRKLALVPKWIRKIPAPLMALPCGALLAWALAHFTDMGSAATIGSRFSWLSEGRVVAGIPRIPPIPGFPWGAQGINAAWILSLLPAAFAIAMLGSIESLLSAVVGDGIARTRHDPDAELIAIGFGNVLCPFFGGIPATGAIARTAANYRFGGRTPVAAMAHALTVLAGILILAPWFSYLPMSAMGALLLVVAWNMSEVQHFIHTVKTAPGHDVIVLWTCFLLTVLTDMVIAVTVGVVLSALLFMGRMASETEGHVVEPDDESLPEPLPDGVIVYDIIGPLFFGAAERAMRALRDVGMDTKAVIFRFERVTSVDATGIVALEGVLEELHRYRIKALFVGMRKHVENLIRRSGLAPLEGRLAHCHDTREALAFLAGRPPRASVRREGKLRFRVLHRQKAGVHKSRRQVG